MVAEANSHHKQGNHALKALVQNIQSGINYVTRSALYAFVVQNVQFRPHDVFNYRSLVIMRVLTVIAQRMSIFKKDFDSKVIANPKFTTNNDFLESLWTSFDHMFWIAIVANSIIFIVCFVGSVITCASLFSEHTSLSIVIHGDLTK